MSTHTLHITLRSDATFASGEGVPAQLDVEVDHDEAGFPVVRGRRLAGVLAEEGLELLFACRRASDNARWSATHERVFGRLGSDLEGQGALALTTATLPADLRAAMQIDPVTQHPRPMTEVLWACTDIRRQTTINAATGAPARNLLRATRVALKDLRFETPIEWTTSVDTDTQAWLAGCVMALRRGGLRRNRGRGRLHCVIVDDNVTREWAQPLLDSLRRTA